MNTSATTPVMTALWGGLAELVGLRAAIAAAGLLALPAPLFLRGAQSAMRVAESNTPAISRA